MTEISIVPMTVPRSVSGPDAADFNAAQAVINSETARIIGSEDYSRTPEERLPFMTAPGWKRQEFVAKVGTDVVGWARYETLDLDDNKEGSLEVFVDSDHREQGVGTALLAQLLQVAAAAGRTELLARVMVHEGVAGPTVVPATGVGSVPAADTGVAFALARGFGLEQVDQINRLPLPVPRELFEQRVAIASAGFGDDYELVHWAAPTPEEYLDDLARLYTEMSTAEMIGDHEPTEDVWDANRMREYEAREKGSPRRRLYAAARERSSGLLVAFTLLDVPGAPDGAVNQWSTLVSAAHRGRRLGLAIKLENLRQLMSDFPGHPSVTTMNAEENEPMIALNESVGFAVVGHVGNFRRSVEADVS